MTVVLDSAPSNNTIYYVSMTTPTTTESLRSQIIVWRVFLRKFFCSDLSRHGTVQDGERVYHRQSEEC